MSPGAQPPSLHTARAWPALTLDPWLGWLSHPEKQFIPGAVCCSHHEAGTLPSAPCDPLILCWAICSRNRETLRPGELVSEKQASLLCPKAVGGTAQAGGGWCQLFGFCHQKWVACLAWFLLAGSVGPSVTASVQATMMSGREETPASGWPCSWMWPLGQVPRQQVVVGVAGGQL